MSEWISVDERMPEKNEDNDGKCYYTFSYGEVRDDEWFSTYPRESDGWGSECQGGCFYQPNSDSDYGGEFKADGVTHWMEMPPRVLPEPQPNHHQAAYERFFIARDLIK